MRLRIEARNATVAVEDGLIVPPGRQDVVLKFPGCEVRPGLINAHEHLHRNHYGRLGNPPYPNAYAWGRDIHARHAGWIARRKKMPRREALLYGAWKNLVAGVTTVVHHDRWEPDFEEDFPLRVARINSAHSVRLEPALPTESPLDAPFGIHLAEGTDAESGEEVRQLERAGLLSSRLMAVHVVGVDEDGIRRLRSAGAALVWCPTSNLFLLGRTAPPELLAPGVDVLLGSDSLLTAAGSLLDELRAARSLGLLDDERLLDAVGATAARRLGLEEPSLREGSRADLVVLRRSPLEADAQDVRLVVAGGVVRVADNESGWQLEKAGARGVLRRFGRVVRWIDQRTTLPRSTRQVRSA